MSHGRRVLIEPEIGPSTTSPRHAGDPHHLSGVLLDSRADQRLTEDYAYHLTVFHDRQMRQAIVVLEPGALLDRRIRVNDSDY